MKFAIGYFYPNLLNLYGDDGNVEILACRANERGIHVDIVKINPASRIDLDLMKRLNIVFMGGGPDSSQKEMYGDLIKNKGEYLKDFITGGGVGLFICGSYQLLGSYYKAADGSYLEGLGVFDLYTEHFGNRKPRCIGNIVCEIIPALCNDPVFSLVNKIGSTVVGFENHGGRTFLGEKAVPFAKVIKGYGNNSEDGTEGVLYNNAIGTYLHGPILARNPHLADYLIAKSLNLESLEVLDDSLILSAHTASKKLKQ